MHHLAVTRSMLYVERVPSVFVPVMPPADFLTLTWAEKVVALDRAVKTETTEVLREDIAEPVIYPDRPELHGAGAGDARSGRARQSAQPPRRRGTGASGGLG